ncbi:hypothetical protein O6H91_01G135000 [Diphasiastrum complanatum]|uniref:Uncharacterized protein n=1 Tax=Diphasiastrum complanatum TaxID=34168 RepID=A0ACC2EWE6_DIPCM|nr:hypothetical protein O6H91_01G135000 [Diphasiastrum complanatum]
MVVFKNRYMVMEILGTGGSAQRLQSLSQWTVTSAIKDSILINFGQHGLATCLHSLQVKYVNPITHLCVVRCSRDEYQRVWCAISFITTIENVQVIFNLLDLSGNVRPCREAAAKYDELKLKLLVQRSGIQLPVEQVERARLHLKKIEMIDA